MYQTPQKATSKGVLVGKAPVRQRRTQRTNLKKKIEYRGCPFQISGTYVRSEDMTSYKGKRRETGTYLGIFRLKRYC